MAQKGNLLSVRQDIRVVDATIRDGGLCNDFRFSDKFVQDLYKANLKAGVDYMEFGYKASKEIFDEDDFGKWKFCNDDDIRAIVGEGSPKMKIAVMADVGRTDFEEDIIPKSESPIDLVRIATYINTIPSAVEMIEYCAKQGYETTINIMAVSKARTEDIITALEILGQTPVSCFYIVDSYGSLYPEEARRLSDPSIPRKRAVCRNFTARSPRSTANPPVSTPTTTSSSPLRTPSKPWLTARATWTRRWTAWAEAPATAPWSCCSVSSKTRSTRSTRSSALFRTT